MHRNPHARRARAASPALLLLPLLPACVVSHPKAEAERPAIVEGSIARIAEDLVEIAQRRTDLRDLRIAVAGFHPEQPDALTTGVSQGGSPQDDRVEDELVREFVLALANRVYLVDRELPAEAPRGAGVGATPRPRVTHVVVGDYAVRGSSLLLSVRLVDTDSHLILAATRGAVPLSWLSESARRGVLQSDVRMAATPAAVTPLAGSAPPVRVLAPIASGTPIPSTTSVPLAARPPVEDFRTWQARRQAEGEGSPGAARTAARAAPPTPAAQAPAQASEQAPSEETAPPNPAAAPSRDPLPWRTAELARLLGIHDAPPPAAKPTSEKERP